MDGNRDGVPEATVHVDHRTSRKASTAFLNVGLRLFRGHLTKIKQYPAGSQELHPPSKIYEHCNVHERIINDIRIYDINVRSRSTKQFVAYQESVRGRPPPPEQTGGENLVPGPTARRAVQSSPVSQRKPMTAETSPLEETKSFSPPPLKPIDTTGSEKSQNSADKVELLRVKTRDFALSPTVVGPSKKTRRHIYYLAGGSWQMPPTGEHWKLLCHLTRVLTSRGTPTTISVISHPLAPHCPAGITLPMLEKLYYELFPTKAGFNENGEIDTPVDPSALDDPEIIIAGDSSGGNIALGLVLGILTKDPKAPAPDGMMLISPAVDMDMSNPEIKELEKIDPVLSYSSSAEYRKVWMGSDISATDPRVSPILADLDLLKKRNITVHGVNGGADLLGADVRKFVKKLGDAGVRGKWLEWDKQMHVFPLAFSFGIPESKDAVRWMVETLDPEGTDPPRKFAYEE